MQLPVVLEKNSITVREFFERLVTHVKALELMGNYKKSMA